MTYGMKRKAASLVYAYGHLLKTLFSIYNTKVQACPIAQV